MLSLALMLDPTPYVCLHTFATGLNVPLQGTGCTQTTQSLRPLVTNEVVNGEGGHIPRPLCWKHKNLCTR